jgi:hypothetical protein
MRKRTIGVVLLAGLAMSGAGAFTASNNDTAIEAENANVAGYSNATVTGATVTAVDYVQDTANASLIDQVKFVATGNLVSKEASVILWNNTTSVGNYTCTGSSASGVTLLGQALSASDTLFTCSTPDEPIADFNSLGITVNN